MVRSASPIARSDIRDIKIHRLRNTHDPLLTIFITTPAPPRSRRLRRRQRNRIAPRVIIDSRYPIRIRIIEDAVRLVELIGIRVEMTTVRLVNFMEVAVLSAPA